MMIYHITPRAVWEPARARGEYRSDTLDTQGFIHCSTSRQVVSVANSYYPGQQGLVLLCIDENRLRSELRYESPAGPVIEGEYRFPHIYGPLNTNAVIAVLDFKPGSDGLFTMPEEVDWQ
jgi:uncharacterized protein (DUF952 family)